MDAAARVRDLNFRCLTEGKGATVTARFGKVGITHCDPSRTSQGAAAFRRIDDRGDLNRGWTWKVGRCGRKTSKQVQGVAPPSTEETVKVGSEPRNC